MRTNSDYPYRWGWHTTRPSVTAGLAADLIAAWLWETGGDRFGHLCRVLARARRRFEVRWVSEYDDQPLMHPIGCLDISTDNLLRARRAALTWYSNSVLVEFADGYRMVASGRGLRKKHQGEKSE